MLSTKRKSDEGEEEAVEKKKKQVEVGSSSSSGGGSSGGDGGSRSVRPRKATKDTKEDEEDEVEKEGPVEIFKKTASLPNRDKNNGDLVFDDHPEFRPNLTPEEVLNMGSFGGTYFRPIRSKVTKKAYGDEVWKEFPPTWFASLKKSQYASASYNKEVNRYKVSCGADLDEWESKGWMRESDPYGWFQWYCRFYLGRRTSDDSRQIARGVGVMGPKGRWRSNLANKCIASGQTPEVAANDARISPVIRQTLQHWGFRLLPHHLRKLKK